MTVRRTLEGVATLFAAALVAVVVAWWGWRWFGPAATDMPVRPAAESTPSVVLAVSPPFGMSHDASTTPDPRTATAAAASGDLRLLGVIAGRDGSGQALLRFPDGSARLVTAGARLSDSPAGNVRLRCARPPHPPRHPDRVRRVRPPAQSRVTIEARWCASMPSSSRA